MIQTITSNDLSVIKTKNIAVVFSADWCESCHQLLNHMEPMSNAYPDKFYNADIDDNEDLSENYNVKSLPCIILFKDGKQFMRFENNYDFSELMSTISNL